MIFEGSRYQNSLVLTVTAADGATRPTIYSAVPFPPQVSFLYHTVKPHDRLDSLAALYYRNPELWWVIANANPDHCGRIDHSFTTPACRSRPTPPYSP